MYRFVGASGQVGREVPHIVLFVTQHRHLYSVHGRSVECRKRSAESLCCSPASLRLEDFYKSQRRIGAK